MIFLGETDDPAREVAFHLPDANDPIGAYIAGHVFATGEVKIRLPGAVAYVDADVSRVKEKGYGDYALQLTDAQVTVKGKVYIRVLVAGAQPWTSDEDILSRAELAAAIAVAVPASNRAWTLAQLRRAVLRRAGEPEEGTQDLTPGVLNEFINEAIAELWDLLLKKADERLVVNTTLATTIGTQAVALPASFYRLRKVEIADSSSPSGYRQLFATTLDAQHLYSSVTGEEYRYWQHSYSLEMVPVPQAVENLRVWYIPVAPVLVDDGDAIDGYNGYEELVVQLAFRRTLVRQNLETSPAETEIARLVGRIEAAADGRDAEPFYLSPRGARRIDVDEWEPY